MRSAIVSLSLASLCAASAIPNGGWHGGSGKGKGSSPSKPAPAPQCKNFKSQNANFDDLQALPAEAILPVPQGYKGLFFQSFNTINDATTQIPLPQVLPHSPPNYAGTGLQSELLAGTPMITTNYENSQTASFSLQSFYFGCVTAASTLFSVPSACDITITGYRGSDNSVSNAQQVCSRQFQYNPSTVLGTQQQAFSGAISGCDNIQFVLIQFSPPGGSKATGVAQSLLIDDVKFTTCDK